MSNDIFITFCSQCNNKCHAGTIDELGSHQTATGLKHKAIKQNKCLEKCIAYISKV
jgi:hypothetical protein